MNDNEPGAPVGPERTAAVVRDLAARLTAWTREPGFAEECAEREPADQHGSAA